jgi:lipoprotein NlpI
MANGYNIRGNAWFGKGDYAHAIQDYTTAIKLAPDNAKVYANRGYCYYDQQSWTEALRDFQMACSLNPSHQEYRYLRIWLVRARLGDREKATRELKWRFGLRRLRNPDDPAAQIALFLMDQTAEEAFFKAVEAAYGPAQVKDARCVSYFYAGTKRLIAGDKATARDYFQKSLDTGMKGNLEHSSAAAELKALEGGN